MNFNKARCKNERNELGASENERNEFGASETCQIRVDVDQSMAYTLQW